MTDAGGQPVCCPSCSPPMLMMLGTTATNIQLRWSGVDCSGFDLGGGCCQGWCRRPTGCNQESRTGTNSGCCLAVKVSTKSQSSDNLSTPETTCLRNRGPGSTRHRGRWPIEMNASCPIGTTLGATLHLAPLGPAFPRRLQSRISYPLSSRSTRLIGLSPCCGPP